MSYFDDLNSILSWYTNHFGTFDKQIWEHSVEERIFNGINHIPRKTAKFQSEYIDLDLVRGSSFSKAKPKHGLFYITKQGILRFLFLPFYHKWFIAQTSKKIFSVFLALYIIQFLNVFLYLTNPYDINPLPSTVNSTNTPNGLTDSTPSDAPNPPQQQQQQSNQLTIQLSEILSPLVLMIALTVLLSQIVSTHSSKGARLNNTKSHRGKYERRTSPAGLGKSRSKRSKRNSSRYPPSRRMSSLLLSVNNLAASTAIGRPHLLAKKKVLANYLKNNNDNESLDSINSDLIHSPSNGIRKVFFEDESKASASSNSDKDADEGIAEENGESHEENVFSSPAEEMDIDKQIIEKNLSKTLHDFKGLKDDEKLFGVVEKGDEDGGIGDSISPEGSLKRSNLRKRNVSKLSEASTTTDRSDCPSCGECSNSSSGGEMNDDEEEVRSKSDWTAVTTNSEDDDYGDEHTSHSEDEMDESAMNDHPFAWELQQNSKESGCSSPASDKVSCTIWEDREIKKADLTVLDISSTIIAKVERARGNSDYLYLGILASCILAFLPCLWRLNSDLEIDDFDYNKTLIYIGEAFNFAFGNDLKSRVMILISFVERLCLAFFTFFLLSVAEKTYKQRFLFAKIFSRLTSSRKARKSEIPHFRLNKVRNIKTWLSIRSYLQRRGPQRSVDMIVSATFIATLILIFFLSVELLKDSNRMYYLYNIEVIGWSLFLGIFLMRYMTLGARISQKYRNLSVIITEQLNLYLRMEQKPHKKEELLVANNVLKLAAELLKEIEDPFKISSFASNPYLYNVTRLVILSAFSGVLSEMLGFKLKLYKIKIK